MYAFKLFYAFIWYNHKKVLKYAIVCNLLSSNSLQVNVLYLSPNVSLCAYYNLLNQTENGESHLCIAINI